MPTLNICGGIENFVMNYYRHIDRDKIQFDFLVHEIKEKNFLEEVESLGGTVYLFPKFTIANLSKILNALYKFYILHDEYKILHCHMANAALFHFFYSEYVSNKTKILHSHQPLGSDKFINNIRNSLLLSIGNRMCDVRFAGSIDSGRFLFKDKHFTIIKNAVDADYYQNSRKKRTIVRRRLNLEEKFVVGHIGRFAPVKNHLFILDIIQMLKRVKPNVLLILVGEGETKNCIKQKVIEKNLQNNVIFVNTCQNVGEYYAAFDLFLLPSLFEGFGLVAIEAQYVGVPVLASLNRVPEESRISNYIEYIPLEAGTEKWVERILEISNKQDPIIYTCNDYDIKHQAVNLENIYMELYKKYEIK